MQTAPLQDSVTQITWKYGGPSPPLAVYHLSSTSWPTSSFPEFCPSVCFSFHFPVRRERSGAELQVVLTPQRSLSTRVKDGWTAGTRRKRWNESKHQNDRWRLWKIKKTNIWTQSVVKDFRMKFELMWMTQTATRWCLWFQFSTATEYKQSQDICQRLLWIRTHLSGLQNSS